MIVVIDTECPISLHTKIKDSAGNERHFKYIKVDYSKNKKPQIIEGEEIVLNDKNQIEYRRIWQKKDKCPYDYYVHDVKNPPEPMIVALINQN